MPHYSTTNHDFYNALISHLGEEPILFFNTSWVEWPDAEGHIYYYNACFMPDIVLFLHAFQY